MSEVLFYHLTESRLEDALPPLLEKSLQRGWKVVVQFGGEQRRDALDSHLWTFRDDSFLGHGTEHDRHPALQPILLTCGQDNPNGAAVRFLVDGAPPPDLASYSRAVILFDGHDDEQLQQARLQWKTLKDAGHQVTYWQQGPDRRWEKKA